jgi:nitrogen fixation protein NifU and related proteins
MQQLYHKHILDHGMNPRNWGILDPAHAQAEGEYPLCGDKLRLMLRLDENQCITAVGWDGEGCAISQASASLLGEQIIGKSLDEIRQIGKQDIFDMLDIPLSMNRVKCALLPLEIVVVALYGSEAWQKIKIEEET